MRSNFEGGAKLSAQPKANFLLINYCAVDVSEIVRFVVVAL